MKKYGTNIKSNRSPEWSEIDIQTNLGMNIKTRYYGKGYLLNKEHLCEKGNQTQHIQK